MEYLLKIKWFIQRMIKRYQSHGIATISAYMAYYWVLSFFPFLIFIISVLMYTNLPTGIFLDYVTKVVPSALTPTIESTIEQFTLHRSTTLLSVGGLITLWSAGMAVNALVRGVCNAYDSTYIRPYFFARIIGVGYTILLAILLIVLMVLLIFGNNIGEYIVSALHINEGIFMPIWHLIRFLMPFIALIVVIYITYRFIPRKYIKYKNVWPGVLFTAVSWYLFCVIFSIYIDNYSKYNQLYGSIGSIFILLIWLYGSCTLLLVGAEINALYQEIKLQPITRRFEKIK